MTDIRKSDAQLDAEAAAPEDRDLDAAIRDHRILFRVETGLLKLHARDGDDAGIGPPFNPVFADYLNAMAWREKPGQTEKPPMAPAAMPWSKSLLFLRWMVCRKTHVKHWEKPEWGGSLCHALVSYVIRHETSLDYARLQLGLPDEGKSRRTLDSALLVIERRLEALLQDDRAKQALPPRSPSEWMAAAYRHQPLGGAHALECENPVCRARRAA